MPALRLHVDTQRRRGPQGVPQLQELPVEGTQKMNKLKVKIEFIIKTDKCIIPSILINQILHTVGEIDPSDPNLVKMVEQSWRWEE